MTSVEPLAPRAANRSIWAAGDVVRGGMRCVGFWQAARGTAAIGGWLVHDGGCLLT